MKNCVALICFFVLLRFYAYSQNSNYVVTGKVYDIETHEPLIGVNVIFAGNRGTVTNKSGQFSFKATNKELHIIFTYVGYQSVEKTYTHITNDTLQINIGLFSIINELEEIVVSANRSEEKISDITVSMSLLKPRVISQYHTRQSDDIINKIPGVEILDGQASIRGGSGYSYGAGSRVIVLIDNLHVLSADAGDVKWHFLPLENLSQIEIIKGASSVLYGSSALNGVVHFITKDSITKPKTTISGQTGIYDKPKRKDWVWRDIPGIFNMATINLDRKYKNNDISIGGKLYINSGYRQYEDISSGRINLKFKHYSKRFRDLYYGLNINSYIANKTDFILWEDAATGALKQNKANAFELDQFIISADPYITLNKKSTTHNLRTRFQSIQNTYPEKSINNSTASNYYADYKYWHKFKNNLNITAGLSQNYSIINSNLYQDHTGYNLAGYGQLDYYPATRLKLIAGSRFEYNILDGNRDKIKPIFRTGINYRIAEFSFIRASFGQGYRYPSVAEKHAMTTVGSVAIFPNPEIKPESGWNIELGLKQGLHVKGWNGQLDIALFNMQNKDLIEYVFGIYPNPKTGVHGYAFRARNIENSRIYGTDIELKSRRVFGQIASGFQIGYTYIYPVEYNPISKKTSDTWLKYRSKHTIKVMLYSTYKKLEGGLNFIYKSKMLDIDDVFLNELTRETILPGFYNYWLNHNNGYNVFDMYFAYHPKGNFKLSLSIKNFTNEEYMGRPGDIMPHRNYSLQASFDL